MSARARVQNSVPETEARTDWVIQRCAGGYGFGSGDPADTDHPAGPGTPALADPLSWSNLSIQYPDCKWTPPHPAPADETRASGMWSVDCQQHHPF